MKKKAGLTLILTILCFLMSAFPAMAGEWHKTAEDQYQYIKDDGTKATGLLELKDGTYYLDDKGNGKKENPDIIQHHNSLHLINAKGTDHDK